MAGQLWVNLGSYFASPALSKILRYSVKPNCKYRQFADVKDATQSGKRKGATFHWNVYGRVSAKGSTLTETNVMPVTSYPITQGTLTMNEYGNSVEFSEKFDNLSFHPVKEIINNVLSLDATENFDTAVYNEFNRTPLRAVATSGTATDAITLYTNGTVTGTNNVALGKNHIKVIVDTMGERNIPRYTGNDYYAIGRIASFRQLKNDLETIKQYTDMGFQDIRIGEIGRYENCRFVEQTNIASAAWTNAKSDKVFFFGKDTVAEAVNTPEEMRGKLATDYGRDNGVAYYALLGFGLVHADATNARILCWDSQA